MPAWRLGWTKGLAAAAAVGLTLVLLLPAQAQFWDWGGRPQRYQRYDPFRDWFAPAPRYEPRERSWSRDSDREGSGDYSHAPAPAAKKPEATTNIVVMGDNNADWLAYGLEDTYSEKPEIGVVRKHRIDSGLIRYESRRETDWAQVAREVIAAEKPKFIVMMIGNNDRQPIREKAPPPPPRTSAASATRPNAAAQQQPTQPAAAPAPAPRSQEVDPEAQPPDNPAAEASPTTPDQARAVSYGPWEFHTEKWEIAYIKRVDATISALKSAGVPVVWVGLPSQRSTKGSSDSSYLNEIYRSRAEKAGITYVDIWDGFVDEGGRYSPQGPDYEGQIRRLRTGDGVYFTKYGARKLAHYVDREIQRALANRAIPVALPSPADAAPQASNSKPGAPAQRPTVGPVVPLTALNAGSDELLGGGRQNRPPGTDAAATRVLTRGEPVAAPSGRADDFSWPRAGVNIDTNLPDGPAAATSPDAASADKPVPGRRQRMSGADAQSGQGSGESRARRPRTAEPFRMPFFLPNLFR